MAISLRLTEGDDWEISIPITADENASFDFTDFTNVDFEGRYGPSYSLPAKFFEVEERAVDSTVVLRVPRSETRKLGRHRRLFWELIAIFNPGPDEQRETYESGVINIQRGIGR